MATSICRICSRPLGVTEDLLSLDCGGDCWGCVGEIEADSGFGPSFEKVLDEWRQGLRPDWKPSTEPDRKVGDNS